MKSFLFLSGWVSIASLIPMSNQMPYTESKMFVFSGRFLKNGGEVVHVQSRSEWYNLYDKAGELTGFKLLNIAEKEEQEYYILESGAAGEDLKFSCQENISISFYKRKPVVLSIDFGNADSKIWFVDAGVLWRAP